MCEDESWMWWVVWCEEGVQRTAGALFFQGPPSGRLTPFHLSITYSKWPLVRNRNVLASDAG